MPKTWRRTLSCLVILAALVLLTAAANRWPAEADDAAASAARADRARAALHVAVEKNLAYCREWLEAKDWKSLVQSADGVGILAGVLAAKGDDDKWRTGVSGLSAQVEALRAAADGKEADKCKELIEQLAAGNKELAGLTVKARLATAKSSEKPIASLRPLMTLLDGTHADAKAALAVGDLAEAKSMAIVLSELGRVVSNQRADAAWRSAAEAMVNASLEAADEKQTDAKAVRQQLRVVYEKCEACHNRQR